MELAISNTKGVLQVPEDLFAKEFNEALIHQVVNAYLAGGRAGTQKQKTRAEVRGGGKKPWRQKGTGRARAGTIRSPLWRGGGIIFAAQPRDYTQKVNKKMYRAAMCSIISELIRQQRLVIVDAFDVDAPKTKNLLNKLKEMAVTDALIVTEDMSENLYFAARNVKNIDICDVIGMDPVNLLRFSKVIITVPAIKQLEGRLA